MSSATASTSTSPLRLTAHGDTATREQHGVRLTRRGRAFVVLVLVALLLAAFAMGKSVSQASPDTASAPVLGQTTVQQGETLWAVARRIAPQRDPRDVVGQLRRLNHLPTSTLQVGQQLLLPAAA